MAGMETTIDKVNIEIESNSSKASSGIDKLVSSIQKLKGVNSEGVSSLSNLNNAIQSLTNNFSQLNNADSAINKTKKSLESLKNYATTLKDQKITFNLNEGTGTIRDLTFFEKFKKQVYGFTENTTKKLVSKTNTAFDNIKDHWVKGDLSKWLKVGAFLGIMSRVARAVSGFIDNSSQYISNMNYFNTTMGNMREEAQEFVDTMSNKFYLDPSNVMNYTASFNSLIKGFGIANEEAFNMSKNLTQLSYDLAAFKGLSIEDAMQKIKSGISGKIICLVYMGVYTVIHLIAGKSKRVKS